MNSSRVSRFAIALICSMLLAGLAKFATVGAQSQGPAPEESVLPAQLSAVDQIAAEDATTRHLHIHPQRSRVADPFSRSKPRENRPTATTRNADSESATSFALSVPNVPAPGFYPADLSNPFHGKVLASAQSNNIYVNCSATCWGTPSTFLGYLALSNFIHITDEYAGTTANKRYTVGAATYIKEPLPTTLTQTNILQLVHVAARAHGSGYDHVYHVFLPKGVDVCLSATHCYSPDRPSTFVFCAYHGSADFTDIHHVLFSVEPYQNVPGCSVAQPSPNGPLVDSTSSTLSHELIETITDPDGDAWIAQNSLVDYGAEIGDLCETPFGNYAAFTLNGKSYAIQPEYSNKFHACATTP